MPGQRGGFSSLTQRVRDHPALPFVLAAGLLATVVGLVAFVLVSQRFAATTQELVSNSVTIAVPLAIPFTSAWAAHRARGRVRLAWRLMGLAGLVWLMGEVMWLVENYVLLSEATPALSDAFYLGALVPAAAALVLFPPPLRKGAERTRILLAAVVVTAAVLFVSRSLALSVILAAAEGGPLARAVYIAYPTADILLASLALIVLLRVGNGARLHFVLLALGFLVYSAADTAYAREGAVGEYAAGSLLDLGWIIGYACFALAPLVPNAWRDESPTRLPARVQQFDWSSLALYVPLLLAVVVAASVPSPQVDPVLVLSGLVTLVVFATRQALLAGDHRRLRSDLESQVGQLKTASSELRQLASANERVVQSVADGVFGVDAAGRVTFVNSAAAAMLRRSEDELRGHSESQVFASAETGRDSGAQPESDIRRALLSGVAVSASVAHFRRGDDSTFPVELAVGPVRERDQVTGAVVVFRDVSARLAVEKMKNEFVSVVSHELRTPLTSIRGSLGLLSAGLGGELSTRGSRMVSIALESSERLSRLIEDMLDLERMESGSITVVPVLCEVQPLVHTAVNEMDVMARQFGVKIVAENLDGAVQGDADRIVQTLTNLLGNSIKFSPRGGAVTVSTVQQGDMVEFSVTDHGRGIPADKLVHIFERFGQVDLSDSRLRGGTGLGLAISRDIVRLHGGDIWVESVLGQGSSFRFTLPGTVRREPDQADEEYRHDLDGVPR